MTYNLKQLVPSHMRETYWRWDNQLRVRTERELYRQVSGTVQGGPFKGMRYIDICAGSGPAGKYLGIYEKELWPILEHFLISSPEQIIDIGAAEGYYAVGLLLRLTQSRVIAFEANPPTRHELEQMAVLNNVTDRLTVHGHCDTDELLKALAPFEHGDQPYPWLIVDIEGGEKELLNPDHIPLLRHCPMLIELHDTMVPGCHTAIRDRFSRSHQFTEIQSVPRTLRDVPIDVHISPWRLRRIIRERGDVPMTWLWLWPINKDE